VISSQQLGERLADARRRAKLTQAQVAEHLSIARTTLVAIEKGERRPSNIELLKLSEVLSISVNELLRESYVRAEISPRFRMYGDKASPAVADAVERLRSFGMRYVELDRLHGLRRGRAPLEALQTYRIDPEGPPELDSQLVGEDAARTVRGMLGLGDEPVAALHVRLESEAGFRIFCLDRLPPKLSAFLIWSDEIGACVGVNATHPPERRRWSLAHELGHFLRDREAGDVLEEGVSMKAPNELFPESFAREFLMPAAGVQKRFTERCRSGKFTPVDLAALARTFEVSFQAMTLRLEELRLLPRGSYEKIVQNRLSPRELAKTQNARIKSDLKGLPERYVGLAVSAYDQELLSESEFAEYLDTDLATAREMYAAHQQIPLDDGTQLPVDFSGSDLRSA
jgi:Zn-dependent peptidase ImmA (M78 family)/transcriptional regulator with XRE-family HTH domain